MPADWLVGLAWFALSLAFASAAWISFDVVVRGYRQHMKVMDVVWPVTALYFGPAAVVAYHAWGRPHSSRYQRQRGEPASARGTPARR